MDQLKEDRLFLQEMLRRLGGLEIDQLMEDRLVQVDMNGMKLQKMDPAEGRLIGITGYG